MVIAFAACVGFGFAAHDVWVRRLLDSSVEDVPRQTVVFPFDGGAFGVTIRTDRPRHPFEPIVCSPAGSILATAGLPTCADGFDIAGRLRQVVEADREPATRLLTELDGAFLCARYDAPAGRVTFVGDFFGALPAYVAVDDRGVAVASTIRAFPCTGLVAQRPDPAGWGAFIGAKHFIGDDTSIAGVMQYPAATVLEYDVRRDQSTSRVYWRWPDADSRVTMSRVDTGAVVDAIRNSVSRYLATGVTSILPLSGGFESRLLAGILDGADSPPVALTIANPYEHHEIEARFAGRVADALGLTREDEPASLDFFESAAYRDYVRAGEVGNTSVNLSIARLDAALLKRGATASWDGVIYGLMMKDFSRPDRHALVHQYLSPRNEQWQAARLVFSQAFLDDAREALAVSVGREINRYPSNPEGDAAFFNANRARRRALPNPLKAFARHALPFMPGLARRCVDVLWRIPVREKAENALYRRVLERHFPVLAAIPYCSHGDLLPGSQRTLEYRLLACRSAVVQHPRVGGWLQRLGVTVGEQEPDIVARAVERVDLDAPQLDPDAIRRLRASESPRNPTTALARELLFYWDAWTRVMSNASL